LRQGQGFGDRGDFKTLPLQRLDAQDRGAAQSLNGFAMILRKGISYAAPQRPKLFCEPIKGGENFGEWAVRVKIQQLVGFHRAAVAEKDRRYFAV
jgi:hypothetical protein